MSGLSLRFLCFSILSSWQIHAQIYTQQVNRRGGATPGLVLDNQKNFVFAEGPRIIKWRRSENAYDTLATSRFTIDGLALSNLDTTLYFTSRDTLWKKPLPNGPVVRLWSGFQYPKFIRIRKKTGQLYALEMGGDNGRGFCVSMINISTGQRTPVAGQSADPTNAFLYVNGVGDTARFSFFNDSRFAFSIDEDSMFIAEGRNRCIRKLDLITRRASTWAGPATLDSVRVGYRDGVRDVVRFNSLTGIEIDSSGHLLIADRGPFVDNNPTIGNRIRKGLPGGRVTTLAGNGLGQGTGQYNNLDYGADGVGTGVMIGELRNLAFSADKDTLYAVLSQRIISLKKRNSTLRFDSLQNLTVGFGKKRIRTRTNHAMAPVFVQLLQSPANVTFASDSVSVPANAETGWVKMRATQVGDVDTFYTTSALDSFQVVSPVWIRKNWQSGGPSVYPNPATDRFTLEGVSPSSRVRIWNALGRELSFKQEFLGNQRLIRPIGKPESLVWIRVEEDGRNFTLPLRIQ